jgi:hypothetical protein
MRGLDPRIHQSRRVFRSGDGLPGEGPGNDEDTKAWWHGYEDLTGFGF